jgi:hypothetical protein
MNRHPSLLAYRWHRARTRLGNALRREGGILWAGLRDPFLAGLLLLTLLLAGLAFQTNRPFTIPVGQQPPDLVYLDGVYDVETSEGRTFRWSRAETTLRIPGLGQAFYRLDLTMAAPRFTPGPEPHLRVMAGSDTLLDAPVGPVVQVYALLLPPEALRGGDLELLLRSDAFTPTGDPRQLGVVLRQIEVRPAGGPVVPSPLVLLWAVLTVLFVVLLSRRLGWSHWAALGAGAVGMLTLVAALAWVRPLLTPGLPYLPLGFFCAWAAVVLFQGAVHRLFAWGGVAMGARAERLLWTVLISFLVVRFVGLLHPTLETFDLCFHYHRLESVLHGQLLFTIVSGEWRSLDTLYLPSPYLVLAPFYAILGGRLVPLKVMMLLLDTSSALLVAYVAHRVLGRDWTSPLAAFFYLTTTQSYVLFSWGIVANIFGQWLFLLLLAFIVSPAGRLERPRSWLAAAGLLVPVMLAHPGTVLLTGLLLAALMATVLLAPLPGWLSRRSVGRWVLAALLALAVAVGLYYSYFAGTMWNALQQMGQGANAEQAPHGGFLVRGPPSGGLGPKAVEVFSLGEGIVAGARELAAEVQVYFGTAPFLLAAMALVGLALERRRLALRLLGLAFWVALGFAVLGLAVNLYVRYMYFLLPIVALGAAWWLARLARRSWAGRAVVVLGGLVLVLAGLSFWVQRVLYFGAGCR